MSLPDDKLLELVKKSGLVDEKTLQTANESAKQKGESLFSVLTEIGTLNEDKLGAIIAGFYNVPYVSLSKLSIPEEVARIIPEKLAIRSKSVAFERDKDGVKVAMVNPDDNALLTMVSRKIGNGKVIPYYAHEKEVLGTIQLYKEALQTTIDDLLKESVRRATSRGDDLPIIKVVETLISAAYQDRASDIHIEPEEKTSLIRFRIDGVLHDVLRVEKQLHDRVISRIKVLSNLRTDEHLSAQDGKMRQKLEAEDVDIRVSIIPVTFGEKAVLRILSSKNREYTLTDLGMNEKDLQKVTNAYNKSFGMILSTGPTGSGKTTSIYAMLRVLNTREKNIMTIEDPVEYRINGANQVQVNVKTNLTFANGLRSILRQDPNIIFVGEIRDSETAAIAVNAALTGHLVLSTLHTNDAATAIPRLTDMKVEPFLVASTVSVIIAQRLVRKICDSCRVQTNLPFSQISNHFPVDLVKKYFPNAKSATVYAGKGCKICHQTGYLGRLGIFEVLEVTKEIRKLISEKADSDVINRAALSEGMTSMLEDGLIKIATGKTTLEEVLRVTKVVL